MPILPKILGLPSARRRAWTPDALAANVWLRVSPSTGARVGGGPLAAGDEINTLAALAGSVGAARAGSGNVVVARNGVLYAQAGQAELRALSLTAGVTLPAADWTVYLVGYFAEGGNSVFLGHSATTACVLCQVLGAASALAIVSDGTNPATISPNPSDVPFYGWKRYARIGANFDYLDSTGAAASVGVGSTGAVALDTIGRRFLSVGNYQWLADDLRELVVLSRAVTAGEHSAMAAYALAQVPSS